MACGGLAVALAAAIVGVIVILTPEDADQGISQKIFYFHVPIALTAYACFGLGAWKALLLLWKGRERHDLESYTAIHQGTIFGSLTLITGSLWAKASWGHWWLWSSNQLVLFLVLFLFYCAYFMLRFSIDPGVRRARISAVYALFGVALIPVSFFAIRLAEDIIHPTTFTLEGPQMDGSQFAGFLVSWAAIVALAYVMYRVELTGKRADLALRELGERQGVSSIVSAAPTRVGVPRAGLQPDAAGAIQRSGLSAGTAGLKSDGPPEERA
jgi:heme exporter protein C